MSTVQGIEYIDGREPVNLGYASAQIPIPEPISGRARVLEATSKAVLSDRNKAYGNPEDNFKNIADVWNWWLRGKVAPGVEVPVVITALDVAHMMTLMKMARLKTNPTHFDSIVDTAGYAACAGDFSVKSVLTGG